MCEARCVDQLSDIKHAAFSRLPYGCLLFPHSTLHGFRLRVLLFLTVSFLICYSKVLQIPLQHTRLGLGLGLELRLGLGLNSQWVDNCVMFRVDEGQ